MDDHRDNQPIGSDVYFPLFVVVFVFYYELGDDGRLHEAPWVKPETVPGVQFKEILEPSGGSSNASHTPRIKIHCKHGGYYMFDARANGFYTHGVHAAKFSLKESAGIYRLAVVYHLFTHP